MTYHYGTETLEELAKVCPAMQYLRGRIAAIARDLQCQIEVNTGDDEWEVYPTNAEGIREAAQWAVEIDDTVSYRFKKPDGHYAYLWVIYDGPYDDITREEIINDYSTSLNDYLAV